MVSVILLQLVHYEFVVIVIWHIFILLINNIAMGNKNTVHPIG